MAEEAKKEEMVVDATPEKKAFMTKRSNHAERIKKDTTKTIMNNWKQVKKWKFLRFIAENNLERLEEILKFNEDGFIWDENAFVGSKNKKLINTHLKGYKFTSLKKGLKKTIKYYEDSISSSK